METACRKPSVLTVPPVAGNRVGHSWPAPPAPETKLATSSETTTFATTVAFDRHPSQLRQVPTSPAVNMSSSVVESLISELDQALAAQSSNGTNSASSDALVTLRTSLDARRQDQASENMQIRQTKSAVTPIPSWIPKPILRVAG